MRNLDRKAIETRLNELGQLLPAAPSPVGNYSASLTRGKVLYISGQLPLRNGQLQYCGALGESLTVNQGYEAAQLCALNALSQLLDATSLHSLEGLIRLDGFICATPDFTEHASVLDGASDLLQATLGQAGSHVRTVIGCNSLPGNACIEIALSAQLKGAPRSDYASL